MVTVLIQIGNLLCISWSTQQHRICTNANLVQFGTLRRADGAIRIDSFLSAEGFTGTCFRLRVGRSLWVPVVLCIANLANIGARRSRCGGNIAAGFVMAVIAGFRVSQPAAALIVFMGTGNFRRSLGVAASAVSFYHKNSGLTITRLHPQNG